MRLPERVKIVEVGPRDGLQNEPRPVATADKLALIDRLAAAGLSVVETTSFVSPRWVPQMADHAEIMAGLHRREGVRYPVLVPNMKGLEAALELGVDEIAIFAAASETFSRRNINCTVSESIARFAPVAERARGAGVAVRGYISCVLGCPYEGDIHPETVAAVARELDALGCYELSLGDTIGVGTPLRAQQLIDRIARDIPIERLAAHFHDTYGQALANLLAVLQLGVTTIDSSVAGLGGCPYAPGAAGNVATEDVLYMLDGLGVETGVDLDGVAEAGRWICQRLGRKPVSRVALALAAK